MGNRDSYPSLIGNISDSAATVVLFFLHGARVDLVVNSDGLLVESILFLHVVEGPVGADRNDIAGFRSALGSTVNHSASSVGLDRTNARSRELVISESEGGVVTWRILDQLEA